MNAADTFNYLAVLYSVVIGLAFTELLQGLRRLLIARSQVCPYWPALLWATTLMVVLAQTWWAMFGLRDHADWTFAMYGAVLLHTVLLYMAAGLALPETEIASGIDMKTAYYAHSRLFFGLLVTVGLASLLKDLAVEGHLPATENLVFHLVFMAGGIVAGLTRREWFHKFNAVAIAALIGAYVTLLFSHS